MGGKRLINARLHNKVWPGRPKNIIRKIFTLRGLLSK